MLFFSILLIFAVEMSNETYCSEKKNYLTTKRLELCFSKNNRIPHNENQAAYIIYENNSKYKSKDIAYLEKLTSVESRIFYFENSASQFPNFVSMKNYIFTFSEKIIHTQILNKDNDIPTSFMILFEKSKNIIHFTMKNNLEIIFYKHIISLNLDNKKSKNRKNELFCWIKDKKTEIERFKYIGKETPKDLPPFTLLSIRLQEQILYYLNINQCAQYKGTFPFNRKKVRNACWQLLYNSMLELPIFFALSVAYNCFLWHKKESFCFSKRNLFTKFLSLYSLYNIKETLLHGSFPFILMLDSIHALIKV